MTSPLVFGRLDAACWPGAPESGPGFWLVPAADISLIAIQAFINTLFGLQQAKSRRAISKKRQSGPLPRAAPHRVGLRLDTGQPVEIGVAN
jgi:hypothetical protein